MLVDHVWTPRGHRAAHRAQASCLAQRAHGEDRGERAGGGLVNGQRDRRITDPRRQREHPPVALRHGERVRDREIRRGNQQGSLRQGDLHGSRPTLRALAARGETGMSPSYGLRKATW